MVKEEMVTWPFRNRNYPERLWPLLRRSALMAKSASKPGGSKSSGSKSSSSSSKSSSSKSGSAKKK